MGDSWVIPFVTSLTERSVYEKFETLWRNYFLWQIDVSKRALKTELEEIENKCLNASNDVPTVEIQNQISILEGRINSTNENVDIQSENINELKVRRLLFSLCDLYQISYPIYISADWYSDNVFKHRNGDNENRPTKSTR